MPASTTASLTLIFSAGVLLLAVSSADAKPKSIEIRVNGPAGSLAGISFSVKLVGQKGSTGPRQAGMYRLSWRRGGKRGSVRHDVEALDRWLMERGVLGRLFQMKGFYGKDDRLRITARGKARRWPAINEERALKLAERYARKRKVSTASGSTTTEAGVRICDFMKNGFTLLRVAIGAYSGNVLAIYQPPNRRASRPPFPRRR